MDDEVDFDQASELQVRDINTQYDPLLVHINNYQRGLAMKSSALSSLISAAMLYCNYVYVIHKKNKIFS